VHDRAAVHSIIHKMTWIKPVAWPPRSPDLSLVFFFSLLGTLENPTVFRFN